MVAMGTKKTGIAARVMSRIRGRRFEMKVTLTKEAVGLLYYMFCSPLEQWEVPHQYKCADFKARREFSSLSKWIDARLLSPDEIPSTEKALQTIEMLKKAYDGKEPRLELREQVWRMIKDSASRRIFQSGEYSIKKCFIERIEDVFGHYVKKDAKRILPTSFGDLEQALKGEAPPSAEDVIDSGDEE